MNMEKFKKVIDDYLAKEDRSQAFLARRLGFLPETFNKWLIGENRIPYEVVGKICNYAHFDPQKQTEMFDLAGYPLPKWVNQLAEGTPVPMFEGISRNNIILLSSNEELWRYSYEKMLDAKRVICDLTWGIDMPSFSDSEDEAYFTYVRAIPDVCRKNVLYREVMTFNDDPAHFISRAESILSQNLITYNLRYFDITIRESPPFLQCTIVDEEELTVGLYRWPYLPIEDEVRLIIRQPEIVRLFQDYFETIWVAARPIKEGDRVYHDVFDEIKGRFRQ